MIAIENLCQRCAHRGGTCCQHTDIFVTRQDVRRIRTLVDKEDYYEYREPADPDYADQADDPVWQTWVLGNRGRRRVLKHDADGNCVFLTAAGCRLPLALRPLICRLHPHLYNHRGLSSQLSPSCPLELLTPGERLEDLIAGFDVNQAATWHHMLYDEIRQEETGDAHRIDL